MDPYMGTGHRNERAREQAGLSEAFVAPPGTIVTPAGIIRPPPPAAPLAAAPAAGAAAPLAGLAALAGLVGAAGGLWVKRDIDRFKKKAKLPFYDSDYIYTPGDDTKVADYAKAKPQYDPWDDALTRERIDRAVERYLKWYFTPGHGEIWINDPDFLTADGFHGPIVSNGNAWVWWRYHPEMMCSPIDRSSWATDAWFPNPCPGTGTGGGTVPGCFDVLVGPGTYTPSANWVCPADATVWAVGVHAGTKTVGHYFRKEFWDITSSAKPASQPVRPVGEILLEPGTVVRTTFPLEAPLWPQPWREAVAPPGTQPSSPETHPRPKKKAFEVPISFSHPLTAVRNGSMTVAPPDTVIVTRPDGGVDVIIRPPSHPVDGGEAPGEHPEKPYPKLPAAFQGARVFVNFATESIDFIDSLHQAIPRHLRGSTPGGPSPGEKLEEIYDNWQDVNVGDALENFLNNQIEDMLYGKLGKAQGKAAKKMGRPFGPHVSRAGPVGKLLSPSLPVPEVNVDEDGNLEVTIGEVVIDESTLERRERNGL